MSEKREPTYFEMLLAQSRDSRAERFLWKPGELVRMTNYAPTRSRFTIKPNPWIISASGGAAS